MTFEMDSDDDFVVDLQITSKFQKQKPQQQQQLQQQQRQPFNPLVAYLLPENYNYKVLDLSILSTSEMVGESQFVLESRINIGNVEEWNIWFKHFCLKSGTSYNKSKADKTGTKKIILSGQRKCIYNVKHKRMKEKDIDTRESGPGRKKGQDRVPGKSTCCPATLTFQIAGKCLNQSRSSNGMKGEEVRNFPTLIKLCYQHNHSINSADALRYKPVIDEAKQGLINYFKDEHSP